MQKGAQHKVFDSIINCSVYVRTLHKNTCIVLMGHYG